MNQRERVIAALQHKETDFIPYQIDFTSQEAERVAAYFENENFRDTIGNHIEAVDYSGNPSESATQPGFFYDDFGVCWNRTGADKDIGVIDGLVLPKPDISQINMPEINLTALENALNKLVKNQNGTFKMMSIGFSMFERAWSLRGMENVLMDMVLEPEFLHTLLDAICNYNLKIVDMALQYDIDGFYFGDDWGQQSGMIMGPALWREFIKPRMAKLYSRVKEQGKFVLQHSCGDIHEIFPDLIEIGLDVYQTFQPEIYDIQKIKNEYGKDLCFWGGISTQTLLPTATPEALKIEVRRIMEILGKGGGYIAAPTHAVPQDVPPENIEALIEVFQNQNE